MKPSSALYKLLFVILAAAVLLALPGVRPTAASPAWAVQAAPQAGALISIAAGIPAGPNAIVTVPVNFAPNGTSVASLVFAIDYDQNWLQYDASVPNAISLSLPSSFIGSCNPQLDDAGGEIKCVIYDMMVPLEPLPAGTILTLKLKTKSPSVDTNAAVGFSINSPPVSFGGTNGQSVDGSSSNGSVFIDINTGPTRLYLPFLVRQQTVVINPTPTPIPTATATPIATVGCDNFLLNSGFEIGQAWEFPITVFPATYATNRVKAGSRSARTGIDPTVSPGANSFSYSSFRQPINIPANAAQITLKFWEFPISGEAPANAGLPRTSLPKVTAEQVMQLTPQDGDLQYVLVLDSANNTLEVLEGHLSNVQGWRLRQFALNPAVYKGTTIKIQFGTFNNGVGGVSALYIDDATLEVCTP